jgi:protein FAM50
VKKRKKAANSKLSFAMDDEAEQEEVSMPGTIDKEDEGDDDDGKPSNKRSKFGKNPNVDTSFLPDRDREEEDRRERERLRQEWLKRQEDMKVEEIEITYSFWDGSGHRKSVMVSHTGETCSEPSSDHQVT